MAAAARPRLAGCTGRPDARTTDTAVRCRARGSRRAGCAHPSAGWVARIAGHASRAGRAHAACAIHRSGAAVGARGSGASCCTSRSHAAATGSAGAGRSHAARTCAHAASGPCASRTCASRTCRTTGRSGGTRPSGRTGTASTSCASATSAARLSHSQTRTRAHCQSGEQCDPTLLLLKLLLHQCS